MQARVWKSFVVLWKVRYEHLLLPRKSRVDRIICFQVRTHNPANQQQQGLNIQIPVHKGAFDPSRNEDWNHITIVVDDSIIL